MTFFQRGLGAPVYGAHMANTSAADLGSSTWAVALAAGQYRWAVVAGNAQMWMALGVENQDDDAAILVPSNEAIVVEAGQGLSFRAVSGNNRAYSVSAWEEIA